MKRVLISIFCITVLLGCFLGSPVSADNNGNGPSTFIPAYYDGKLFTITFKELPPGGEKATELHNNSKNVIYQYDPGLPGGAPFISVLDAIQGDGFNPLWEEFQITFLTIPPKQFFSDTEILAAANANPPQISLTDTEEIYICAVVGPKKK